MGDVRCAPLERLADFVQGEFSRVPGFTAAFTAGMHDSCIDHSVVRANNLFLCDFT